MHARTRGRGRLQPRLALFAWVVAAACGSPDAPGPPGTPLENALPPVRTAGSGAVEVVNRGPRETLNVYAGPPPGRARLSFLRGAGAVALPGGGSAWADPDGARVFVFGRDGTLSRVLQGAPEDQPGLTQPYFAAHVPGGIQGVELDGSALEFRDGRPSAWAEPGAPEPVVTGYEGTRVAARTVRSVSTRPLRRGEPLLWVDRGSGFEGLGEPVRPDNVLMASLANSGWAAVAEDGSIVYVAALRPELRRYSASGELLWTARWTPTGELEPPRFVALDGTLTPTFDLLTRGVALAPGGTILVLVATRDPGVDRLLAFSPDGELVRAGEVEAGAALYAGAAGHVYALSEDEALSSAEAGRRASFAGFELPHLGGNGVLSLEELRGRVVVLNFWASWCALCRREMPLLDGFAEELDPERAVVVGLNEDVLPGQAVRFLEEVPVAYPQLRGEGRLKERYGYRGLPYTVVLDRELRVAAVFYGFGTSIDPIVESVRRELEGGATN